MDNFGRDGRVLFGKNVLFPVVSIWIKFLFFLFVGCRGDHWSPVRQTIVLYDYLLGNLVFKIINQLESNVCLQATNCRPTNDKNSKNTITKGLRRISF